MRWTETEEKALHQPEQLVAAVLPKEVEKSLPEKLYKWAARGCDDNSRMWMHMTQSVHYQTYHPWQSGAHLQVGWASGGVGFQVGWASRGLLGPSLPIVSG